MNDRIEQLVLTLEAGEEIDLRDALQGVHPDDEAELASIIERYTECRIEENGTIDFEEYRRAIPWIFESPIVLRAAFESVLYAAISNGQNPIPVGKAIARGHPLAASTAESVLARFVDAHGYVLPTSEIRPLPCAFGPKNLDDCPRYTLTGRVRRERGYTVYEAQDSMAEELGSQPSVLVWIELLPATSQNSLDDQLRTLPSDVLGKREFLTVREEGVAPSGEAFVAYEKPVNSQLLVDYAQAELLPIERCVRVVRDVASALELLHATGFACGDASPRNIIMRESGHCMLSVYPGSVPDARDDPDAHQAGSHGLISFVSPEQYAGADPTPISDVYQLGALLLWMTTGRCANGSDAEESHRYLIADQGPEVIGDTRCPAELLSLAYSCLERAPGARPISATSVREGLDRWLNDEPMGRIDSAGFRFRLFVRRNRSALLASAIVLVSMVASSSWLIHRNALAVGEEARNELATRLFETRDLQEMLTADLGAAHSRIEGLEADLIRAGESERRARDEARDKISFAREILQQARQGVMLSESDKPEILLFITSVWQSMEIHDPHTKKLLDASASADAKRKADDLWRDGSSQIESALWQLLAAEKLMVAGEWESAEKYLLRAERLFESINIVEDTLLDRLRTEIIQAETMSIP